MSTREIMVSEQHHLARPHNSALATRDLLQIGIRRRGTFARVFLLVMLGAVVAAIFLPKRYESEIKILVHRERADPLVTSQQTAAMEQNMPSLTEEDINSEVAILRSEDLLEKVVMACDLQHRKSTSLWDRWKPALSVDTQPDDEQTSVRKAALKLNKELRIEPVKKSYIIAVSYSSTDPQFAAYVLNTLGNLYLEKHAAVHRPNDAYGFFERETDRYKGVLDEAQKRLADFNNREGIVTDEQQKDSSVPKLAEFEFNLRTTQAAIPSTQEHIHSLEALLAKTPQRITTQLHKADNGALMQQLKSSLVNLQTQKTDLLNKYAPGDRMVQEVEKQISQVQGAIDAQQQSPLNEETTDENPTHTFLMQELAKARADLASLKALASSSQRVASSYHQNVIDRDQKQIEQQALIRDEKAAEANYLLYLNKREEARISNAFDKNRILNVSIAQSANVPVLPSNPASLILMLGAVLGCLCSGAIVLLKERLNPPLQTAEQFEEYLDAPVLASIGDGGAGNRGMLAHH